MKEEVRVIRVRTSPPFWFPASSVRVPPGEGTISSEDGVTRNFKVLRNWSPGEEQDRT